MSNSECKTCPSYYETLHSSPNIKRINNVNVIKTSDGEELGFCHIPVFTDTRDIDSKKGSIGVYLAIKHLNYGIGDVVPELNEMNEKCYMRFTTDFFNTEGSG